MANFQILILKKRAMIKNPISKKRIPPGVEVFDRAHKSDKAEEVLLKRKKAKLQSDIIISKVKETAFKLKAMYERDWAQTEKLEQKKRIIEEYRTEILANADKFSNFNPEKFKKTPLNNENFIGILRYHSGFLNFSRTSSKKSVEILKSFMRKWKN